MSVSRFPSVSRAEYAQVTHPNVLTSSHPAVPSCDFTEPPLESLRRMPRSDTRAPEVRGDRLVMPASQE